MPLRVWAIAAVLSVAYFQGVLLEGLFSITAAQKGDGRLGFATLAVDAAIAILFMVIPKRHFRLPAAGWAALGYLGWSVLSGVINGSPGLGLLYARHSVYYLGFYVAVYNARLTHREFRALWRLVIALSVLQLAVAAVQVLLVREHVEWRVGTIGVQDGSLATVYPLFAMCLFLAMYYARNGSPLQLMISLSFSIIPLASGKRAFWLLFPLAWVGVGVLDIVTQRHSARVTPWAKFTKAWYWAALPVVAIMVLGINSSEGMGDQWQRRTVGETLSDAVEYALSYDTGYRGREAAGRGSASAKVLEHLTEEPLEGALFGFGPGAFRADSGNTEHNGGGFAPLGIFYGIVGWSRDALAIGFIGAALHLLMYALVLRDVLRSPKSEDVYPLGRAARLTALAGGAVVLYSYCLYSTVNMVACGAALMMSWYLAAGWLPSCDALQGERPGLRASGHRHCGHMNART